MPIYEYRCKNCRSDFEVLILNSSDEEQVTCPQCEGHAVERVLSCFCKTTGTEGASGSDCTGSRGGFKWCWEHFGWKSKRRIRWIASFLRFHP